jgi:hypothetical protein
VSNAKTRTKDDREVQRTIQGDGRADMSESDNRYSPPKSALRDSDDSVKPSVFMIRVIATFMAIMGMYWLYGGLSVSPYSYTSIVLSIVPFVAAVGLWLKQNWSQYPVHLLSVLSLGLWCWQLWYAVRQHTFPYPTLSATIIGLVITLLPLFVVVGSSAVTFRYFRGKT